MRTIKGEVLYEVSDVEQLALRGTASSIGLQAVEQIVHWVRGYLACPHAHLGRSGKVCPFIPEALRKRTLHFAVESQAAAVATVREAIAKYLPSFRELAGERQAANADDKILVGIIVLFPAVTDLTVIDTVQGEEKLRYVEEGLMLGQFHQQCQEPGIRNPAFMPLRSPVPLLAIRHMVPSDLVFLSARADYLRAFKRFIDPSSLPPELVPVYNAACDNLGVPR